MIKFFEADEIKNIYWDTLASNNKTISCFTNYEAAYVWNRSFFKKNYFPARIERNIHVKNIVAENEEGRAEFQKRHELLREMKFIDMDFKGEINIYNESVAIVVFDKKPFGIIIKNKEISKVIESLFNHLWDNI